MLHHHVGIRQRFTAIVTPAYALLTKVFFVVDSFTSEPSMPARLGQGLGFKLSRSDLDSGLAKRSVYFIVDVMKKIIRKLLPEALLLQYHRLVAHVAAWRYGKPSREMVIIGVTGTKGKTSTSNYIWSVLMAGGYKTGIISTANIRVGDQERVNEYHMTMPGRFELQRLLREMADAGCRYCLVETTSEGIKQYRHTGVAYDIGVFTNLTPEHLSSHGGSFDNYKHTKGKMFAALAKKRKVIEGEAVPKLSVVNGDSEHADYFLGFDADWQRTFGVDSSGLDYKASRISSSPDGVTFRVGRRKYSLSIQGEFNVYNALPALVIGEHLQLDDKQIKSGLSNLSTIPGRMEPIDEGQDYSVLVDYAHEKESMQRVLDAGYAMKPSSDNNIIILLGAEGGGRDKTKRPIMGKQVGEQADYVVVSNVDPYEDDPSEIVRDISDAASEAGKQEGKDLFSIEDRREGISKALSLAKSGDVVLITGKGSEQSIIVDGVSSAWDDRQVTKEELKKLLKSS